MLPMYIFLTGNGIESIDTTLLSGSISLKNGFGNDSKGLRPKALIEVVLESVSRNSSIG